MGWGGGRDLAQRGLFKHWAHLGLHKHWQNGRTGAPPAQLPGSLHSCRAPAWAHALPSLQCMVQMPVCAVYTQWENVWGVLWFQPLFIPPTASKSPPSRSGKQAECPFPSHPRWANSLEGIACSSSMWQHKLIPASDSGKASGHLRDKIGTFLLLAWVEIKCHGLTSA